MRRATATLALIGVAATIRQAARAARTMRRWEAEMLLDRVDAEIARFFLDDGLLAIQRSGHADTLRQRRLGCIQALEGLGGRDPHPNFFRNVPLQPSRGVETLQRFLRDGRNQVWLDAESIPRGHRWEAIANGFDQLIADALDNEAGWNVNQ